MPFAGFDMPVRYSSGVEEHLTVRRKVGIFDVSHMGEFLIKGKGSLQCLQKLCTNDASKITVGQAQYSCMTNHEGGILDDLIIYRLEEDAYMMVVNAGNLEKDWEWIKGQQKDFDCQLEDISYQTCLLAVQGPRATLALQELTEVDLGGIKFYHFTKGTFSGIPEVVISATGYTGSGGFELYLDRQFAEMAWESIMEAGKAQGISPIGLGARDTLRLEKGYCLYGNDITEQTTPLEAGLSWITSLDKDFNGRDALMSIKQEGITRRLVGFIMEERGIPRQGYPIKSDDGESIGQVTSGSQSPCLEVGIGLGYVSPDYAKAETNIGIEIRGKIVKAKTHKLPLV